MIRCKDSRVAIVGRSGTLEGSGKGEEIDACGFVVRINWQLPIRSEIQADVGSRTDLLYTHQTTGMQRLHRGARAAEADACRVNLELREELAHRMASAKFNYIPNTGTVAIFDALRNGASEVRAYGFSLHTDARYIDTGQTHGARDRWAQQRAGHRRPGTRKTHDPERDRRMLRLLMDTDERFVPDDVLREILMTEPPSLDIPADKLAVVVSRWREDAVTLARYGDKRTAEIVKAHADEIYRIMEAV